MLHNPHYHVLTLIRKYEKKMNSESGALSEIIDSSPAWIEHRLDLAANSITILSFYQERL